MHFDFATAARVVFGAGTLRAIGEIGAGFGRRALVVTGSTKERANVLVGLLSSHGIETVAFSTRGEPDVDTIRRGLALAAAEACAWIIGFGGGAAIDTAKAIAVLATNAGDMTDYLEIVGKGKRLTEPPLPFVAIPTTAGSGAEVTRNSVIASPEHRVKVSLRSPLMLARVALVDPELTHGLPPAITAATGVDALTQLIEPFVCTRANPLTDGLCQEGLARVARCLRRAFADGNDAEAREGMAVASLFGGMALANAGLGAVHGLAGPLGGMIQAPHGAVCAALLPRVVSANLRALRQRAPGSDSLRRYTRVAQLLTGSPEATAGEGASWLEDLVSDLGIPGLARYGMGREHIAELVEKASRASSMQANPVELTPQELSSVVEASL